MNYMYQQAHTTATDSAGIIAYPLHDNCYINLTNRCSLRCKFCPKFNRQWEIQGYPLRLGHEPSISEVVAAVPQPWEYREIVYCGLGEPTLRFQVFLESARRLKNMGGRIRLNTDGLANRLHGWDVTRPLKGIVDAVSISLNAQNKHIYNRHCLPPWNDAYYDMLDFIGRVSNQVPDVTLTAIDGLAGVDIPSCREIAQSFNVGFRRRVLDQVG